MKTSFAVSISNPCSENWKAFTPTPTGGFCNSCQKNVIDFTKLSDREIFAFISKMPGHACGRFRSDQLKAYDLLPPDKIRPGFMLLKAGVTSLLLLLISKPGAAQTSDIKNQSEVVQQHVNPYHVQSNEILVRGVVTSAEDSLAMPGISVVHRGTAIGTQTDGNGRFELRVDLSKSDVLVFSFISLETQEYKIITEESQNVSIVMKTDKSQLEEVIVVAGGLTIERRELGGVYTHPESGWKRFWRKVKNWF